MVGTLGVTGTDTSGQNMAAQFKYIEGSVEDAITATASGSQTTSYQLTAQVSRISTVATTADGVKLPLAVPGMALTVINDGANAAQVFPTAPDTIDAVTSATGVALSAAKRATFFCVVAGKWQSMLGAVST